MQRKTSIWGYVTHSLSKSRFSQGTLDEFETMHTAQVCAFLWCYDTFWDFSIIHLEPFGDEYNEDPVVCVIYSYWLSATLGFQTWGLHIKRVCHKRF